MRKKTIVVATLILTLATTIIRIVGMIFRIYLANVLGAEGIGLYQLILSFYFLMVTLATSGIRTAVSRLISEQLALKNYQNAKNVLCQGIILSLVTGLASGLIMFYFADSVGGNILKDKRTILALLYLAPSLPLIAVSSCYKGYFFAVGRVLKPAIVQVTEQLLRIFVIIYLMKLYLPLGLEYACAAVSIGMLAEEIFSALLIWIFYVTDKRPFKKSNAPKQNMMFEILKITIPISGTSYVNSMLRTLEDTLIPARMLLYGASAQDALSLYGMIKGMVLPLLFFPSSFLTSLSSILIPSVAGDNATSNEKKVTSTLSKVLHFTSISGILVVGIFIFFPSEIAIAVYNNFEVGTMLKLITIVCPFMYLNMVISSMLSALGEEVISFKINIIESIIKISMIYFLLPIYGFNAYLAALLLTTVINTILYLSKLLQKSCIIFDISNWIIKPISIAIASGYSSKMLYRIFISSSSNNLIALISSLILLCLFYLNGLIIFKSVNIASFGEIKKHI